MIFQQPNKNQGFTLVELIVYIAVSSFVLAAIGGLVWMLMQSRAKSQAIAEVEQQGALIMDTITQSVRNAESITAPTVGNTGTTLTLDVVEATDDPTIFTLSSSDMEITEGVAAAVALNADNITVSNVEFYNLSRADTPGALQSTFTLTIDQGGKGSYHYEKTFRGTASLR